MAASSAGDEDGKLDMFDGSDPSQYRLWKRRAKLMLAGLPSTVASSKYGARLMKYVKGEAESLLEYIEVDTLIKEGGDEEIFKVLDEKYLPQPRDLMQQALKGFFYELQIRPGETFQQFIARFDAAQRKLKEQKVTLPKEVQGFFLLRKLRLDSTQESLVLTATRGSLEIKDILDNVRGIFPEGRGSAKSQKEVFQTEDAVSGDGGAPSRDEGEDLEEVLEVITDPYQSGGEEEEVLDVFESYTEIRKKLLEKKKMRGFVPQGGKDDPSQWRLSGTVRGKLEVLKSKTKCHACHKYGHWKRECPARKQGKTSKTEKPNEAHLSEVWIMDDGLSDKRSSDLWESLQEKPPMAQSWKTSVDVQQDGFSDTHATGNQQRHGDDDFKTTITEVQQVKSPTREEFSEEEVLSVIDVPVEFEVLSAERALANFDPILETNAVPDTACRRTLIGEYTLSRLEQHLMKQGYKVKKVPGQFAFRFGNSGTLVSHEIAILPACLQGKHFVLKASILPAEGKCTPLLLSKECLRSLKVKIDCGSDVAWFGRLGVEVRLGETERGHYAVPMFDFHDSAKECLVASYAERKSKKSEERSFDISHLERLEKESIEDRLIDRSLASSHGSLLLWRQRVRQPCAIDGSELERVRDLHGEPNDDEHPPSSETDASSHGRKVLGRVSRFSRRWNDVSSTCQHSPQGGQVCQEQAVLDSGENLCSGQGLHPLGQSSHQSGQLLGNATPEDLCPSPGLQEEDSHGRGQLQDGSSDAFHTSGNDDGTTVHSHGQDTLEGSSQFAQVPEGQRIPHEPGRDGSGSVGPCVRAGESHEAREEPSGLGTCGHSDGALPADQRERHGQPSQPDGQNEALEVHDEHDLHVEDGPGASSSEQDLWKERGNEAWPEKEDRCGVMSKRVRKEIERNLRDIQCCDHEHEGKEKHEDMYDMFHVQLDHGQTDVGEAFSTPRVVPQATKMGLKGGKSYDIGTGWNFLNSDHRKQCRKDVSLHKPRVLVISPPCGPFSQMLRISKHRCNQKERERKRVEGLVLLEFAMELAQLQLKNNRIFIFEHPCNADSWKEPCVQKIREATGVHEVYADQCMFGLKDPQNKMLFKKGTRFLTNSKHGHVLHRKCDGNHTHQSIEGQCKCGGVWVNRSTCAQVYPRELVNKMVLIAKKEMQDHVMEVFAGEEDSRSNLKIRLNRAHVNLGHPSRERFIHLLKCANATEEAIKLAKEMSCATCSSRRLMGHRPVASSRRAEGFNQQVSMDTFEVPFNGKKLKMLNTYCEGTGYQMCSPLWNGASAGEVRKAYRQSWLKWAGAPTRVLTDGGLEFDGEAQEGFDRDNTFVDKTAAYSPHQNGRCERHGGLWKQVFLKAFDEMQPRTKDELEELTDHVNAAKNMMTRRHGFSPMQHVFGCEIRLPGISHANTTYLQGSSEYHPSDGCLRSMEIRLAARRAMVELDNSDKVKRAMEHSTRALTEYNIGDYVYYWRVSKESEKHGLWKGPARVIGKIDSSKLWIAHGNKVLRCSPLQLKLVSEEHEAALRFIPPEALRPIGRGANRGARTFIDITKEELPPHSEEASQPSAPRTHRDMEVDRDDSLEERMQVDEDGSEVNEESTKDESKSRSDDLENALDMELDRSTGAGPMPLPVNPPADNAGSDYGPIRTEPHRERYEPTELTQALRRSTELLDQGNARMPRSSPENEIAVLNDSNEVYEITPCTTTDEWKRHDKILEEHLECFMTQDKKHAELRDKDLQSSSDQERVRVGKQSEWSKLLKAGAIQVHTGQEALRIREQVDPKRIIESRFVKTKKGHEEGEDYDIKCRWVIKGFQDPDLDVLERQSPTLSADGLSVALQLIASKGWVLEIADVEGVFLQGESFQRKNGPLFIRLPKDGVPGVPEGSLVELKKCVYGLNDAPLRWWTSMCKTLKQCGMIQSELDPCIFWYHHNGSLSGVLALHVDDMIMGGNCHFQENVLKKLKETYPFKHWVKRKGDFLGRKLYQKEDFSIEVDQQSYSKSVQTIPISKDRRKEKDSPVTDYELKLFRGVLGTANWIVGTTRPDIAVLTAQLQQRVSRATVSDLIEANRLVSKIRDFNHVKITYKNIPMEHAVLVSTSDASWSNTDTLGSQAGYFLLFADKRIKENTWADVTPLRWKTYKLERKTQSTLGAELMSAARTLAEGNWLRSIFAEALYPDYTLQRDRVFRDRMELILVVDNKPLYDHTKGNGVVVKDKRVAIDMLLVRRDLYASNSEIRWVDTRQMLSDALTKCTACSDFMLFVLKFGKFILVREEESLEWRQKEREIKKRNESRIKAN